MEKLEPIFTTAPAADNSFPFFSVMHIIPIILAVCVVYAIIINRDKIKQDPKKSKLIMAIIVLVSVAIKQTWYLSSDLSYIKEGLPFYLCRLTFLVTVISFLFNSKKMNFVIIYHGTIGGIMAILVPDTSGYVFPHIFYLNFFFSHTLLLASALVVYICDDYVPSKKEFGKVVLYNLSFVIIVNFINHILGSNYGYIAHPPLSLSVLNGIDTGLLYKFGVFAVMTILSFIPHILYNLKFVQKMQFSYQLK